MQGFLNHNQAHNILIIEAEDSIRVVDTVAKNLVGVANNRSNFDRLPDTFWGYMPEVTTARASLEFSWCIQRMAMM